MPVEITGEGGLCVRWRLCRAADADINQASALTDYLCGGLGQRDKTGRKGGFEQKEVTDNLTTAIVSLLRVLLKILNWFE